MGTRWTSKHTGQKIDDTIDCVCNPNLLDNWYFLSPVNQRGQTSYIGAGYGIDRWKSGNSNLTVNLTSDGIVLSSGSAASYLSQYFDAGISSEGSYTISALVEAITGTAYLQVIYADGTYGTAMKLTTGLNALTEKTTKTISRVLFQINAGASVTVKAAKLELGSQQTLAHQDADGKWVLNEISDYGEQLARCQRYCQVFGYQDFSAFTHAYESNAVYVAIPLPVALRTAPTINDPTKFAVVTGGYTSENVPVTGVSGVSTVNCYLTFFAFVEGGLTVNNNYPLKINGPVVVSADL